MPARTSGRARAPDLRRGIVPLPAGFLPQQFLLMRDEPDALSRHALLLPYDCVRRQDPSGLGCPTSAASPWSGRRRS